MNMICSDIKGGLGNVLFQISTAYVLSLKYSTDFIVDLTHYHGSHHPIDKYKTNIFRKIKFSETPIWFPVFTENTFHYKELPKLIGNTKISGYFQSEKYFKNNRKEVLNLFSPTEEIITKLQTMYGNMLNENTCSIHIRRGDYLKLQHFHSVLNLDYYKKSTDIIGNDCTFLIFSDDIEWCKSNFDFIDKKIFIEGIKDYEEIYLMSLCKHNIVANSSFSWWGAWMNENEGKKVISPSKWFGPQGPKDTQDIIPINWIKID